MKKNYLTYPVRNMNITQNYSGRTSHAGYSAGSPADYPIDEAGADRNREFMYCPCDEMVIKRIYGVESKGTNTLWLESCQKVFFADGTSVFFSLMIVHPEDDDLKKLHVGQILRRGEKICREGSDGHSSGNHFHFSGGKGKIAGSGWKKNSNNKWVLTVSDKTDKPENLFFIDRDFTKVQKSGGLIFKPLPNEEVTEETYVVTASLLNVRKGPGTNYDIVLYENMTDSAKKQILSLSGRKRNGYVRGTQFTVSDKKGDWAKTPSGWVCLKYCKKK